MLKNFYQNMNKKTAVITGVSSGLGLALVKTFLKKDYIVFGLSKSTPEEQISNDDFHFIQCDIRNYTEIEKVANQIPVVDILVNNAGIILQGDFDTYTPSKIQDVIDTDLTGLIFSTHAFLDKIPKKPGSFIINISSTAGVSDKAGETVYRAAKHGVKGFSDSLRLELGKKDIKVIGLYPGGMQTKLFEKSGSKIDLEKFMDPNDIAKTVMYIVEQPDSVSIDSVVINRGLR